MNYNTSENSQILPQAVQYYLQELYNAVQANKFRGDFLAAIGRKTNDSALIDNIVANWREKGW